MTDPLTTAAPSSATLSPAAARMRRCRERRRKGLCLISAELRATEISALILRGFLKSEDANDCDAIRDALYQFLEHALDRPR
jgi:hypothetical protein